jgi:hypothetical protein
MTREEILQAIRVGPRWKCRGPLSPTARTYVNTLLANPDTKDTVAPVMDRANRGRDVQLPIIIALHEGPDPHLPQLAILANGTQEDYAPLPLCGSEHLNSLIEAGPWDGKYRQYRCPNCSVSGIYATPVYELED